MTTVTALERLRTPEKAEALAERVVDHVMARPLGERWSAPRVLEVLRRAAAGWDDARLDAFVVGELSLAAGRARALSGSLADHAPPGWLEAARRVLKEPVVLSEELVLRLVDHPETRALTKDVLAMVLADFVRRASTPLQDNRLVSGVMSRARGFMKQGVTGSILSAVGEGLNAEADRRIRDFLDDAVGAALAFVVAQVCDRRHAATYGALRAGMVTAATDATVAAWTDQVMALEPARATLAMARAVRDSVHTDAFAAWLSVHLPVWLPSPDETLGEVLTRAGLSTTVRATAVPLLADELSLFFATDEFASFFAELHGEAAPVPRRKKPRKKKA